MKMLVRLKLILLAVIPVLRVAAACGEGEADKVRLALDWYPNANHAGLYMALEKGYFADVVVFDPAIVGAGTSERVYDLPGGADRLIGEALGIDAVIVNGTLVRHGGTDTLDPANSRGKLPGKLLRNGHALIGSRASHNYESAEANRSDLSPKLNIYVNCHDEYKDNL